MAAVDPLAIVVPDRILRRVIRQDRRIRWLGGVHPRCYAIAGSALGVIVEPHEMGRPLGQDWPATALLIACPPSDDLAPGDTGAVLVRVWRRVFRARVEYELTRALDDGRLDAVAILTRIEAIGGTEFAEARAVLRQDGQLLDPATDGRTYAAFGAVFLELTYFDPLARAVTFPAIESPGDVEAVLAADVDGRAWLAATRPAGAPDPTLSTDRPVRPEPASADESSGRWLATALRRREGAVRAPALVRRARAAAERGNHVRAAILLTRSAHRGEPEGGLADRAAARSALNRLAVRLRKALFVRKGEATLWVAALSPLLERAAEGFWRPERRLLHDLQNVCLDHEREVFRLEPLGWLFSMGRRPLRHPLPLLREVAMTRHLRSAARRLHRVALDRTERARLEVLLRTAGHRAEGALRERFRHRVGAVLDARYVAPANLPERVARDKLVEEMLDPIVARGFSTLGDLRDAASRGNLKLLDVASPVELVRGDRLLATDRELAASVDGVHRQGEVYMRWLQRASALAFGTPIGRLFSLFLALPFGGAFVLLKGLEEIHGLSIGRLTGRHLEFVGAGTVVPLGLVALGIINVARFRGGLLAVLRTIGRGLRLVLLELPARVLAYPLVRRLVHSLPVRVAWRFAIRPGLFAAAAWGWARLVRLAPAVAGTVGTVAFGLAFLAFNTRPGRRLVEQAVEGCMRTGHTLVFAVIPGLFHLIMAFFDRLIEWVERLFYAVDEWLRFREGQSAAMLGVKAVLGIFWGAVAYVVRIYLNLFVEPTLNPIKHFPVVTVAAKIMLPFTLELTAFLSSPLFPILGRWLADGIAWGTVVFLPGVFGFLVWELNSNWRLYEANRPRGLGPLAIGSHGETVVRFLRPAFHSGTLPKRFARLRHALASGHDGAAARHREAIHHVEEAVRRLVERDIAALLNASRSLGDRVVEPGSIRLATNRIRVELIDRRGEGPGLWVDLEDVAAALFAGIHRAGWLEGLDVRERRPLADALAGLYKIGGVQRIRPADDRAANLANCPNEKSPALVPGPVDFAAVEIPWGEWVAVWDAHAAGDLEMAFHRWRAGILPACEPSPSPPPPTGRGRSDRE